MRTAILTDIHGNLPALEAVLAETAREGIERIVNLGDILSGPLWPRETAERLMPLGWPTIAGNHERQLLAIDAASALPANDSDAYAAAAITPPQREWLRSLPPSLHLDDGAIRLTHGTPRVDHVPLLHTVTPGLGEHGYPGIRAARPDEVRARLDGETASLVICGHSHLPRVLQLDGGRLIVDAGSVGLPAYDHDEPYDHKVETGSPHAHWAVVERTPQGWRAELRLTAYDWEAAARRAESNGRDDWAAALRTGRAISSLKSESTLRR